MNCRLCGQPLARQPHECAGGNGATQHPLDDPEFAQLVAEARSGDTAPPSVGAFDPKTEATQIHAYIQRGAKLEELRQDMAHMYGNRLDDVLAELRALERGIQPLTDDAVEIEPEEQAQIDASLADRGASRDVPVPTYDEHRLDGDVTRELTNLRSEKSMRESVEHRHQRSRDLGSRNNSPRFGASRAVVLTSTQLISKMRAGEEITEEDAQKAALVCAITMMASPLSKERRTGAKMLMDIYDIRGREAERRIERLKNARARVKEMLRRQRLDSEKLPVPLSEAEQREALRKVR